MKSGYLLAGFILLAITMLAANTILQPIGYSHSGPSGAEAKLIIANGKAAGYNIPLKGNETAFGLLQSAATVGYRQYSFGKLITSINSLEADSSHNWFFFINGRPSTMGADSYYPKGNDSMEFRYLSNNESAAIFGWAE